MATLTSPPQLGQKPRRARLTTPEMSLAITSSQATLDAVPRSLAKEVGIGVGLDADTVQDLLDRQAPVVAALSRYQRDHFLSGWQYFYLRTLAEVQETWATMRWAERRDAAVIMGIATERALLVSGQPTAIIAGVHEHRHALPALAGVLAEVARRLGVDAATVDAEPATLVPSDAPATCLDNRTG